MSSVQIGEREVTVYKSLWPIRSANMRAVGGESKSAEMIIQNKQQGEEQASEEEQIDLGMEYLRLKSFSKKVDRQLPSKGKKAKKQRRTFKMSKTIAEQTLSQNAESVLTPQ